tara:strand:+ start:64 stop:513 length:450 start_codon:yes stop_codon:yes gene_type:complete
MREYILTLDSTYIGIICALIAIVPPWILYLDKFRPLVELKKEIWLNHFIPWAWLAYSCILLMILFYPAALIFPIFLTSWIIGTLFISIIIYFIPKPTSIKKRIYFCFDFYNVSELDKKKWENSFIRKFIVCHFWSHWIYLIIYFLFLKK